MPIRSRAGVVLLTVLLLAVTRLSAAQAPANAEPAGGFEFLQTRDRVERLRQALESNLPYVPGEVLVKFRSGTNASDQQRVLSVVRGPASERSVTYIADFIRLEVAAEPNPEQLALRLVGEPEVEWAQPNYLHRLRATPNDANYTSSQWNLQMLDMPRAWDINPGGSPDVIVAVVDTGITTVNETYQFWTWNGSDFELISVPVAVNADLSASRLLPGRDFVFWTGPPVDFVGHGTHVTGTIGQTTNNSLGFAGMAYNTRLLPAKACFGYWEYQFFLADQGIPGFVDPSFGGGCPTDATVQAIRYAADQGAKVINLSLGGPGEAPAYLDAIRYATERGAFVAIAMGNEFEDGNPVEYPAAYAPQIQGAVSVGAIGRSARRAFYSNTGAHIELAAPGGDVRDGGQSGLVFQAGLCDQDFDPSTIIYPRFDRSCVDGKMGTSMATPHVAGMAALLISQGVTAPAAVEAALKAFAKDLGMGGHDNEHGHGLIDPPKTLRGLGIAR